MYTARYDACAASPPSTSIVGDYARALGRFEEALVAVARATRRGTRGWRFSRSGDGLCAARRTRQGARISRAFSGAATRAGRPGRHSRQPQQPGRAVPARRRTASQHGSRIDGGRVSSRPQSTSTKQNSSRPASATCSCRRWRWAISAARVAFLGDLEQAMELFERQLDAVHAMGDRHNEALCLANIGEALRLCGRPEAAIEPLQRALAIGEELSSKPRIMRAHQELSACREAQGEPRGGTRALQEVPRARPDAAQRRGRREGARSARSDRGAQSA